MCEYILATFGEGSLNMSVVESLPKGSFQKLGETTIDATVSLPNGQPGQAMSLGVQKGDYIISIDGFYVAYISHKDCVDRLKNSGRPLTICFARPDPQTWSKFRGVQDAQVFTGSLKTKRWMGRWHTKGVTITKQNISIVDGNELERKIPLDTIERVVCLDGQDENSSFEILMLPNQGKNVVLKADSVEERNTWVHVIDAARYRAFDVPLANLSSFSSSSTPTPTPPPPHPSTSTSAQSHMTSHSPMSNGSAANGVGFNTKLQPATAAAVQARLQRGQSVHSVNEPKYISDAIAATNKSPYWMLYYSKLAIGGIPSNIAALQNTTDYSTLLQDPTKLAYSLSLERKYLNL